MPEEPDASRRARREQNIVELEHQAGGAARNADCPGLEQPWHRRAYLALQSFRGRPVGRFVRQLQTWERLDAPAFERLVEARLSAALRYAKTNVPLYSSGPWRSALAESGSASLQSWPVLERHALGTRPRELLARRPIPGKHYRRSSQSSGIAVRVAIDPRASAWNWAAEYRAMAWHGVPIGAKALMLWREAHPSTDWIKNCKVYLTGNLVESKLQEAARYLFDERPPLCIGLPSAMAQFARYVGAMSSRAHEMPVRFVKVGGEQVYPFQREEIRKYLGGARTIQFYGCTEIGAIAAECPHGSLHVHAESVRLEILHGEEPVPPGTLGDIALTSLTNRAMPLVRYRVGDLGALSPDPCPCGRPHPVLATLVGRTADVFTTADGRQVHAESLGKGIGRLLGENSPDTLRNVLFEQLDPRTWHVLVEQYPAVGTALEREIAAVVRRTFGEPCRVHVERVTHIPRERSGKFRYYRKAEPRAEPPGWRGASHEEARLGKQGNV